MNNNRMTHSLTENFGRKIKLIRFQKNISQEKLSELSNISRSVMGKIERGEISTTLYSVEKIAKALNVTISQIFDFSDIDTYSE